MCFRREQLIYFGIGLQFDNEPSAIPKLDVAAIDKALGHTVRLMPSGRHCL
jgi:hypothetical protein